MPYFTVERLKFYSLTCSLMSAIASGSAAARDTQANYPAETVTIDEQNYNLVQQRDPNAQLRKFNKVLNSKRMPPLRSCILLLDLPVGTANGNHSFGGVCEQRVNHRINRLMVCQDEMIGHFALQPVDQREVSKEELARFVAEHCYGG
jgi:hypothetical protein